MPVGISQVFRNSDFLYNEKTMNKRDIVMLVIVALILAGILLLIPFRAATPQPPNVITDVPESQFPDFFPSVPIEGYAKVVANYNAEAPDGRVQATRTVTSRKSVAENFALYETFIAAPENGWTLLNKVDIPSDPDHKALFAKGTEGILSVNISAGAGEGASVLTISFVTAKRR